MQRVDWERVKKGQILTRECGIAPAGESPFTHHLMCHGGGEPRHHTALWMSWRKYLTCGLMEIQAAAQFRTNFLFSIVCDVLPLVGFLYLWSFVLEGGRIIHGYDRSQLITYYVVGTAVSGWLPSVWWEVGDNIRDGTLTRFLTMPLDYLGYYFSRQVASQIVYLPMTVAVMIPVIAVMHAHILVPDLIRLLLFVASVAVAFCLVYFMESCLHLLAFWFESARGFLASFALISAFLSGAFFPLDFLPRPLLMTTAALPFYYLRFLPLQIWLGAIEVSEALLRLGAACGYIALFWFTARILWHRGVIRYSAPGS